MSHKPESFPEHMVRQYGTRRQFRRLKRAELRRLESALACYNRGSAYTPGYLHVDRIRRAVEDIRNAFACEWGKS